MIQIKWKIDELQHQQQENKEYKHKKWQQTSNCARNIIQIEANYTHKKWSKLKKPNKHRKRNIKKTKTALKQKLS